MGFHHCLPHGIDYKRKQKFADPEILQNTAGLMDSDVFYEDLENKKKISQLLKHISEEDATPRSIVLSQWI